VAVSMEVCPETLTQGKVRVHVHVALKRADRLWYKSNEDLVVLSSQPHDTLAAAPLRRG
jgi:hypothetical protein